MTSPIIPNSVSPIPTDPSLPPGPYQIRDVFGSDVTIARLPFGGFVAMYQLIGQILFHGQPLNGQSVVAFQRFDGAVAADGTFHKVGPEVIVSPIQDSGNFGFPSGLGLAGVANAPAVTFLPDGRFMVIWKERVAGETSGLGLVKGAIYWADGYQRLPDGRIYNADGTLPVLTVDVTPQLPFAGGENAYFQNVTALPDGGFRSVWLSGAASGDGWFTQSFNADGSPSGAALALGAPPLSVGNGGNATRSVAEIGVGGDATIILVSGGGGEAIYANGKFVVGIPELQVGTGQAFPDLYTNPQIAQIEGGRTVVTWDHNPGAGVWTIDGAVLDGANNVLSSFSIATGINAAIGFTGFYIPKIIALPGGGFAVSGVQSADSQLGTVAEVVWVYGANGTNPIMLTVGPGGVDPDLARLAGDKAIEAYLVDNSGKLVAREFSAVAHDPGPVPSGVNFTISSSNEHSPQIAALPGGGFIAVYKSDAGQIYARKYDAALNPVAGEFVVSEIGAVGDKPVVAVRDDGAFVIAWSDSTTKTIWGSIYPASGTVATTAPFEMTTAAVAQTHLIPAVIVEPQGFILSFEIEAGKATQTKFQAFDFTGQKLGSLTDYPGVALTEAGVSVPISQIFDSRPAVVLGGAMAAAQGARQQTASVIGIMGDTPGLDQPANNAVGLGFAALILSGAGAALAQTQGATGQLAITSAAGATGPIFSTVLLTPLGDGVTRASPEVAGLFDGNFVGVWNQHGPGDALWSIVGQIVTPGGVLVGLEFTITTALSVAAAPDRPTVTGLSGGGFIVTYDAGNTSIAGQKFDDFGNRQGGAFIVSDAGQGSPAAALLANGQFVTLSGNGAGTVTAQSFTVAPPAAVWTGASTTDLGTAGNWTPVAVPDVTETLTFNLASGGILTGTVNGLNAAFSGAGPWVAQGATLTLTGEAISAVSALAMTEAANLTMNGGSIAAAGRIDIQSGAGATMTAQGAAQIDAQGVSLGFNSGQIGGLSVSGAGTALRDTGVGGALSIGDSGSGRVTITGGASVTDAAGDTIGLQSGGTGELDITSSAQLTDQGLIVGASGSGDVVLTNATLTTNGFVSVGQNVDGVGSVSVSGGIWTSVGPMVAGQAGTGSVAIHDGGQLNADASAPAAELDLGADSGGDGSLSVTGAGSRAVLSGPVNVGLAGSGHLMVGNRATVQTGGALPSNASWGLDAGQLPGGSGEVTVNGTQSLLTNLGRFVVGDAGLGKLSIVAGGTVATSPGTIAGLAGLSIANGTGAAGSEVVVSGAGSQLNVTGPLDVGAGGSGGLQLAGGAIVTTSSLDAGGLAAAVGQIGLVDSGTALMVSGAAMLGDGGTGILSVSNGATFAAAALTVGALDKSSGAISLSGTGSALTVAGALTVGGQSSGSLNIANGAAVSAGSLTIGSGGTGSGDVVIGPGSHLNLTGTIINVGLAGSGVLDIQGGTLGLATGTTLSPGTFGRIVQVGGLIDPAALFDASGGSFGGGGTAEASGTILNTSLATVSGLAETLLAPLITSGDTLNVAGVWSIKNSGTLVLDANVVDNSQTIQFGDTTGELVIGQQVTLDATQTPVPIATSALSGFAAPIVGYKTGDTIAFSGLTVASDQVIGNAVTLFDGLHNEIGSLIFQTAKGGADNAGAVAAAAQIACFAAGTLIETVTGPRAVETLTVGDRAITRLDGPERIVWVGSRAVHCAGHPNPETVWPIRVAKAAFGPEMPSRDLYLSPDHAVFVNGVLIPVKLLANGTSIVQVKRERVTYYHVELQEHAVILAEGLPVESYLDAGDRTNFNAGATIRLFPDFAARLAPDAARLWESRGAAPLVLTGSSLDAAARMVTASSLKVRAAA